MTFLGRLWREFDGGIAAILAIGVGILSLIAAYITHIVWIVSTLAGPAGVTFGQFLLGFLGLFIPPIGVVHGLIIWFT